MTIKLIKGSAASICVVTGLMACQDSAGTAPVGTVHHVDKRALNASPVVGNFALLATESVVMGSQSAVGGGTLAHHSW